EQAGYPGRHPVHRGDPRGGTVGLAQRGADLDQGGGCDLVAAVARRRTEPEDASVSQRLDRLVVDAPVILGPGRVLLKDGCQFGRATNNLLPGGSSGNQSHRTLLVWHGMESDL